MKTSNWILCTAISGALLGSACATEETQTETESAKAIDTAPTTSDQPSETSDKAKEDADLRAAEAKKEAAIGRALNAYVECINGVSKFVFASRNRYLSWAKADPAKPPTGKERYITRGLNPLTLADTCLEGLADLSDPGLPKLFAAGTTYTTVLSEIMPVVKQARTYYEEEDYKDDKAAKAKEWHPILINGFRDFAKADSAMRRELSIVSDARQQEYLKKMESELGRTLPYLLAAVGQSAKTLIRLADADKKELKLDAVEEALTQYVALVAEMESYATDHPEETKKYSAFFRVINAASKLRKESKSFVRNQRDKKKSSIKGVVDAYNGWVDASNSVRK